MQGHAKVRSWVLLLCVAVFSSAGASGARAQVSPSEIVNPELKALEETYFPQLKALHQQIGALQFPFPFLLSRYVGLDPAQQAESDSRGLEFVRFHERVVLKVTGNYNAAYNAEKLTKNQRATRTFDDVVLPTLRMVAKTIPTDVNCEAIGFEIAHHVRSRIKNADYEGKEILVFLFDREDAFALAAAAGDAEGQEILNRSEIYVNGERYGLALGKMEPLDLEALRKPAKRAPVSASQITVAGNGDPSSSPGNSGQPNAGPRLNLSIAKQPSGERNSPAPVTPGQPATPAPQVAAVTSADTDRLQAKYQSQLDAFAQKKLSGVSLVEYAPPSFAVFQHRVVLQATLRNPLHFDKDNGSIYRRAAQSFDLYLALHLKDLLEQVPQDTEIYALDLTLLNQIAATPKPASEALEFSHPL